MPNLQAVLQDPTERQRSVGRMLGQECVRVEVSDNHGIRNAAELTARILEDARLPNRDAERAAAFEEMLGA